MNCLALDIRKISAIKIIAIARTLWNENLVLLPNSAALELATPSKKCRNKIIINCKKSIFYNLILDQCKHVKLHNSLVFQVCQLKF